MTLKPPLIFVVESELQKTHLFHFCPLLQDAMSEPSTEFPCGPEYPEVRILALFISYGLGSITFLTAGASLILLIRYRSSLPADQRPTALLHYVQSVYFVICFLYGLCFPVSISAQCRVIVLESHIINALHVGTATVCRVSHCS